VNENLRAPYLVLQVIPPIGPRLLDAPLFLDDGAIDDSRKHGKRHRDTMVVVTMNRSAVLETGERAPINDDPILKLVRLDPKFGCTRVSQRFRAHDRVAYPIGPSSP
jgi:hypothetical protein